MGLGQRLVFSLVALAVVGAGMGVYYVIDGMAADVYVDNFSGKHVAIELDGKPWLELKQGETTHLTVKPEAHEVVVRDKATGNVVQKLTIDSKDGHSSYVFNVNGAKSYVKASTIYTEDPLPDDYEDEYSLINESFFEANVDYIFREPPDEISVSDGVRSVTKTYLLRIDQDLVAAQ